MWLVRLRKPRAVPRRCPTRPLTASGGLPGWSKRARMSPERRLRVRPSVTISVDAVGTPAATESGHGLQSPSPGCLAGVAAGGDEPPTDPPSRFEGGTGRVCEQPDQSLAPLDFEVAAAGAEHQPRAGRRALPDPDPHRHAPPAQPPHPAPHNRTRSTNRRPHRPTTRPPTDRRKATAPQRPTQIRPTRRTRSHPARRRQHQPPPGLPNRHCENPHHRKTSTPITTPTRRAPRRQPPHPQL